MRDRVQDPKYGSQSSLTAFATAAVPTGAGHPHAVPTAAVMKEPVPADDIGTIKEKMQIFKGTTKWHAPV